MRSIVGTVYQDTREYDSEANCSLHFQTAKACPDSRTPSSDLTFGFGNISDGWGVAYVGQYLRIASEIGQPLVLRSKTNIAVRVSLQMIIKAFAAGTASGHQQKP